MSRLLYSPAAKTDLDAIWTYTAVHWGEVQAAQYLRDIDAACLEVAMGFRPARTIDDIRPGYRKINVRSHKVFFMLNGTGATVVIRILHQRMDVESHLPSRS